VDLAQRLRILGRQDLELVHLKHRQAIPGIERIVEGKPYVGLEDR
jgi:hypothetical protein